MLIAYLFGVAVRLWLLAYVGDVDAYWLDGRPVPIYSADAGLYGFYAKKLLGGAHYPFTAEYMPGHLIYFIVEYLGIDIDRAMLLLPAFLAPLIAIPVVLIGVAIDRARLGFLAALIAVIGINFYTRSYLGYMDTDTLNLFFPYTAIAMGVFAFVRRSWLFALAALFFLYLFSLWYHSSLPIIAALLLTSIVIAPVVFKSKKTAIVAFLVVIVAVVAANPQKVLKRVDDYIGKREFVSVKTKTGEYKFADTLKSVAEAQQVDILSSHASYTMMAPYAVAATFGFIVLAFAAPAILLLLPLFSLYFLAAYAGVRFAMFATPAMAIGFVAFGYFVANYLRRAEYIVAAFGVGLMLLNIARVQSSFTPTFFFASEVKAIERFAEESQEKDLLISWWDYGWPLWYYSGRNNTLIDNGRHGIDTYLVANMLLGSDRFCANALAYLGDKQKGNAPILPMLLKQEDILERMQLLATRDISPKRDRDRYILLHRDMLLKYKTLEDFAFINPKTGEKLLPNAQLYISDLRRPYSNKERYLRGDTFDLDLATGIITGHDGAQAKLRGVVIVENNKMIAAKPYGGRSGMTMIVYNATKAIYLDNRALNSFLVRALLLDRYDKNRFELVAATPQMKILKLRR